MRMKIKQISDHVWSLRSWMVIPFHVWIVVEEDGVTLVDAGMSFMARGILSSIEQLQAGPLRRIALTHGHPDHIGSLQRILQAHPVPVYAHRAEIPYLEGQLPYPGKKLMAPMAAGTTCPLPEAEASGGIDANVSTGASARAEAGAGKLADEGTGQLAPLGKLQPYFTPGHSPGHTVFYHAVDRLLIAGDLFSSRGGKLRKPYFTPVMDEVLRSSQIVNQLRPARMEVCHGDAVFNPAGQLDAYIAAQAALQPQQS